MHKKSISYLFKLLNSSPNGLSGKEAKLRLKKYGYNTITAARKKSLLLEFFSEFKDLMVIILIVAAIIAGLAGERTDMSVILFIVILNSLIGFAQKFKAEKAIEALKKMVSSQSRIIRDGKEKMIDAKFLVPGDIIILNEGDKINADARLLEVNELQVSEATLTGESIPVHKKANPIEKEDIDLDEHKNMIFMGTSIARGTGKAIILKTGMKTQFGKIAHLTTSTKKDKSPLEKEMFGIGIFVGKITVGISILLFLTGFFIQGKSFIETFLFATAVAVAAVPEGLPATITIALALGVQKLARHNAIVKQLSSVETLGSTTVICSDKTGTLTKNEMTVKEISFPSFHIHISGVGYSPKGALHFESNKKVISLSTSHEDSHNDFHPLNHKDFQEKETNKFHLLRLINKIGVYCNNAELIKEKKNKYSILGDPTEASLLTLAEKSNFSIIELRKETKKIQEFPFDSERKRMSIIMKDKKNKTRAYCKGAPDNMLKLCTHYLNKNNEVKKLTPKIKKTILEENQIMANKALRVLALTYKDLKSQKNPYQEKNIEKDLIFVGLTGIIDPPRDEVKNAVALTKKAGIKTYVVTGDHGLTAKAIAVQLGIVTKEKAHIITGTQVNKMSDKKLLSTIKKHPEIIFARVSPQHKLKIVSAIKDKGEIVAVTGDGVNDAPALKRADIGVAMGITGTDVSKEAANMILANDSFSTIVTAIKEGRTIYENLKKFIFYIFSCNIGELLTVFAAIIFNFPSPLTAILILCVDLGTDVLPALALGIDPPEPGIMEKKPRNPNQHIMQKKFILRFLYLGFFIGLIVLGTYFFSLYSYGWSFGDNLIQDDFIYLKATSIAFAILVLIQMVNTFNARSENNSIFKLGFFSNKWLIASIIISIGVVNLLLNVPFFQQTINTTSLTINEWMLVISASFSILFIEETRKAFFPFKN